MAPISAQCEPIPEAELDAWVIAIVDIARDISSQAVWQSADGNVAQRARTMKRAFDIISKIHRLKAEANEVTSITLSAAERLMNLFAGVRWLFILGCVGFFLVRKREDRVQLLKFRKVPIQARLDNLFDAMVPRNINRIDGTHLFHPFSLQLPPRQSDRLPLTEPIAGDTFVFKEVDKSGFVFPRRYPRQMPKEQSKVYLLRSHDGESFVHKAKSIPGLGRTCRKGSRFDA
jgi:hypothetical protein